MTPASCLWCDGPLSGRQQRFCSGNCRKRYHDDTVGRKACADCGGPMGPNTKYRSAERCRSCEDTRQRERVEARWTYIERRWAEGAIGPEIAAELGVSKNWLAADFGAMRRAGRNLPYRHRGYSKYGPEKAAA